ncbi:hypothetical protein ABZY09_46800 [Streptomyces sp. NPDC002928]|uniref:hypothetical protein n=1 Tax=Streptomyces sp. NPDC002928 TaxID=3154440 RepID=UPI0033ADD3E7
MLDSGRIAEVVRRRFGVDTHLVGRAVVCATAAVAGCSGGDDAASEESATPSRSA